MLHFLEARGRNILLGCDDSGNYKSCYSKCEKADTCDFLERDIKKSINKEVRKMKAQVNSTMKIVSGVKLPEEFERRLQQLEEKDNELRLAEEILKNLNENDEIVKLRKQMEELEEKLKEVRDKLSIDRIEYEISMISAEREAMMQEIGDQIPDEFWGQDTFSKKKKAVSSADGKIVLVKSTSVKRSIPLTKLVEKFPFKAQELQDEGAIRVTLRSAETKLNKDELEQIVEKTATNKYELRIKDGRMSE